MDRDRAIQYINELLNSEYDLMQDRKFDTSEPCLADKEATESELDEIVNAQEFMTDYITTHIPIPEEEI
tara:strand:- start:59 stop:265 length:207 start_codon:yes stop_codon:yes gene_type:complete